MKKIKIEVLKPNTEEYFEIEISPEAYAIYSQLDEIREAIGTMSIDLLNVKNELREIDKTLGGMSMNLS